MWNCEYGRPSLQKTPPFMSPKNIKSIRSLFMSCFTYLSHAENVSLIEIAGGTDWMARETLIREPCLEYKLCPRLNVLPDADLRSD